MVKHIAAAGETFAMAGWREDAGFQLFHFPKWAKARAMQHWIDRSGIAHRPRLPPFNGPQLRLGAIGRCRRPTPSIRNDQACIVGWPWMSPAAMRDITMSWA